MSRVLSVLLALMAVAWAQPAAAEPSAQAAFRAMLVKYDQRADAETDIGRLRTLAAERARFRMPYFSIRIEEIREGFPERRFP